MGNVGYAYRQIALKRLTDRESRFVLFYVSHLNATEAAKLAGYSKTSAKALGARLLSKSHIAKAIGVIQRQDAERLQIDSDDVLRQLAYALSVGTDDYCDAKGNPLPMSKWSERAKSALEITHVERTDPKTRKKYWEKQIRKPSKIPALEQAMKHKGLFDPTKFEHKHTLGIEGFRFDDLIAQAPSKLIEANMKQKMLEMENKALGHKVIESTAVKVPVPVPDLFKEFE